MADITRDKELYLSHQPGGRSIDYIDVSTGVGEVQVDVTTRMSRVDFVTWQGKSAAADVTRIQLNVPAAGQFRITCTQSSDFRFEAKGRGR